MNLYLLRHGETEWNKSHRFQGRIDVPLNEFGRELACITREKWPIVPFGRVFCSPLSRAYETAQIVLEGRPEQEIIELDDRIIEFGFGGCEGSDIDEAASNPDHPIYNLLHHPEKYVPPTGAESFDELIGRASAFLEDKILPLEQEGIDNVLIVAHGAIIRGFVCAMGLKEVKDFWAVRYLNCCLTKINIHDGKFAMEDEARIFYDFNDHFGGWRR